MRKSNTNVIFLFLILFVSFISLSSATINVGKGNQTLVTYSPGTYLSGYLNISFQNQSLDVEFKDNQGNTVSLIQLLNNSRNKNYLYECDVIDCESNYQSENKLSSKTYNLSQGEEALFGLEFKGILKSIDSVKFTIESDAGESCNSQFKLDILDDGIYDFSNNKVSTAVCSGNYTGCYNSGTGNDVELLITNTPLCQKINLSEAPSYQIGAWIAEKTPGASSIKMSVYNSTGTKVGNCDISKLGMTSSGREHNCSFSYLTTKEAAYYVCLYSEGTGGEYKTKGYSLTKGCGFSGLPVKNGTAAYYIFAKPQKFGTVGSVNIGDTLTGTSTISQLAVDYITSKYGTNDCSGGCYVPIRIIANVNQNITIKNFSIKYGQQDLPGIEDNKMHILEEVPAKLSAPYQYLFLDGLFKLPTKLGNFSYSLSADGKTLVNSKMQIKNVSISLSPTKVPIAERTTFRVNIFSDSDPLKYFWVFGNSSTETLVNQASYTYLEEGIHEIMIGVQTKDGGVFSKIFNITVQSPKETANQTLTELETNLKTVNNQIMNLDSFTKSKIMEDLNLTYLSSQLQIIRTNFNKITNNSEYITIINELNKIEIPEAIVQASTNYISYYPEVSDIDMDVLSSITGEYYEESEVEAYSNAILYWNQLNLETKISMKEISYKYNGNLVPFLKTFILQFTPKETLENNTYLIIGYLEDLELNTNSSQKEQYTYTKINGKTSISFSTSSDIDFMGLPLFISPTIESLEVSNEEIVEYKNQWWILAILFALVIIIAFIIYLILHKWYDKKYEHKLFPNRNNLYNLITYINNQKAKGASEEQIRESLRKAKWSAECIRYVMRKYLGKNTGMWKPTKSQEIKEARANPIQFRKGIKKRNLFWHIFLGIITLGLYWIIWLFISSHELRKFTKKAPRFILLLIPFLSSIPLIIGMNISSEVLMGVIDLSILSIILFAILGVGLIFMIIVLIKYSKALKEVTGFNTVGTFLLLLFLYPIGTIVSQVQLNKKANQ